MLDLDALRGAIAERGTVARVVIAAQDGSCPRETGAAMLVWAGGQSGTIGGGALEWQAAARARAMLAGGGRALDRLALGPSLGQCCGGAVTLLTEVFDAGTLPVPAAGVFARPVVQPPGGAGAMPLAVLRILDRARGRGELPAPTLVQGWFVEPVSGPQRQVWIWGAGHVGRAVAGVLAPLPGLLVTWLDVAADRFPDPVPAGVRVRAATDVAALVGEAPPTAEHLVLTYSHTLDLELCHRLLQHGFGDAGLIGSATKWARFRARLAALGHAPGQIARIRCPIGDPAFGKHPQAIAVGVAADVLRARPVARRALQQ